MTTIRAAFILATLTAGLFAGSAGAQEKSLYQRLGGYDAIAAVTDEFIGRLPATNRRSASSSVSPPTARCASGN